MKKLLLITMLLPAILNMNAQVSKTDRLQALEQNQSPDQKIVTIATLKSSSRLFATKNDLTSVIMIIPTDSVVTVLDSDSSYLHVVFEDTEGYIFNRRVVLKTVPVETEKTAASQPSVQESPTESEQQDSRFSYLENKYGSNMAARLMAGKVWKGMNAEMVRDSWGSALKINRVISGNLIKEEWIFRNTWLYFENNNLVDWGPVKR